MANTEANRVAYERMLQFKLGGGRNLFEEGYRALILSTLYEKEATITDIKTRLTAELNVPWIPTHILSVYLEELVKEKKIRFENGKYIISDEERKELEETIARRIELWNLFNRNIINCIKKNCQLNHITENEIIDVVKDILSTFFTQASRLFAGYLMEEEKLVFDLPSLLKIIEEKVKKLQDPMAQEAIKKALQEEILKGDPIIYEFLYEIFQMYVYFEVLNIDPECKIPFNIKTVYLDTNVLMDLLLPHRRRHLLAKEHIKLSQELGIANKYTKKTAEELVNVIRTYKRASSLSESVLEQISKRDDGLLMEFFKEKVHNPNLTFENYCLWLEKAYEKILNSLGVKIDEKTYEEINKGAEELKPIVEEAALKSLDYKPTDSIEHDAFNLQLIREIQCKEKCIVWFITNDYSLFHVSRILLDRGKISKPLSVTSDVWLQALTFIRPLTSEKKTSIEAFKEFLTQPIATKLRSISLHRLLSVAYPWIKEEYLTPEDLDDIASTRFIEEYIIKPQQERENRITVFEDIVPKIISEKIEQKIKKLEEEIKKLEEERNQAVREKKQLEEKYLEIAKNTIKIKPLFFMGVVSFIVFLIFAILPALYRVAIPDIAYHCLLILIIVFIGSSIFGEKILRIFGKHTH
ncbi:MAG: hypothetical protein QW228_07940 [Candidatus Aenigmatarchaeota archaeon]